MPSTTTRVDAPSTNYMNVRPVRRQNPKFN
nr:MAG TPA: hypothetical protein [Caudoviricetes sp.]